MGPLNSSMPAVFEDLNVRTWASIDGLLNQYTILFPSSKETKIRKTLTKRSFVFWWLQGAQLANV